MHYAQHGSNAASLDDSQHEALDKQPRVRAADLGFKAPDHILNDTIPITDSRLIYSNIHAQRDRRLRLLIRRYTNQIQYGCRNVNCTAPTCLSCRKRNTTAPLRKYSELSARTLACHLVDEYSRGGKESNLGLCQNEPVVPWYEDPALAKKRRNSQERLAQHRQENGHLKKPGASPPHTKESPRQSPTRGTLSRRSSLDGVGGVGRRLRHTHAAADGLASVVDAIIPRESPRGDGPGGQDAKSQPLESDENPTQRKDTTSFTQILFDMVPIRLLGWLPSKEIASRNIEELLIHDLVKQHHTQDSGHGETIAVKDQPYEPPIPDASTLPGNAEPLPPRLTYSLKTLTWRNLSWLASPARKDDSGYQSNFIPFIKQTFAYCLSDPERLLKTVKGIQDSYPHRMQLLAERKPEAKSDENEHESEKSPATEFPTIRTKTQGDMVAVLHGLASLDKFNQRDLVMTSVLTALRHSYELPLWLRTRPTRKHSRSGRGFTTDRFSVKKQPFAHGVSMPENLDSLILDLSHENDLSRAQLQDSQITELCLVTFLLLATTIFNRWRPAADGRSCWIDQRDFILFSHIRNQGVAYDHFKSKSSSQRQAKIWWAAVMDAIDVSEDWTVHQLLLVLMDVISHRLTISKWAKASQSSKRTNQKTRNIVDALVARFDEDFLSYYDEKYSWTGHAAIALARSVLLRNWDRSITIQRAGPVGGALELLAGVYRERHVLALEPDLFWMPFIADSFDDMLMPSQWLSFHADNRQMHILSFSFLFEPEVLVRYFRAINIAIMKKSHMDATIVYNDTRQYVWTTSPNQIPLHGAKEVLAHLRPHMAKYFVLTIRRDDILNDAINQIWRRQRRELMKPLRVRIGKDEGEDGLDHGGVQQEFFRLLFAEAFRPDYGMFTVDTTTKMAWFQPGSFEPLYRFEALGILMSLAIYNGITLPITMPLAFYRKLLGIKVKKLDHIEDGWPELSKGLRKLLTWSDGDVGNVIARTYEFGYELCGSNVSVDMQKIGRDDHWPPSKAKASRKGKEKSKSTSFELPLDPTLTPPPQPSPSLSPGIATAPILSRTSSIDVKGISTPQSIDSDLLESSIVEEAALVTNANRSQYVNDYILWLIHRSIEPQYEAFARGFYTCLERTALSIFTPEALQALVEGSTDIAIDELERTATYEEYKATDPTIVNFWQVVRNMSTEQHKRLLEFVTASDRVPVNGMSSVTFTVQNNGMEDSRLPSSSTCYGRLLLPQYSSKEVLEEKLTKAIENSVGFGTL